MTSRIKRDPRTGYPVWKNGAVQRTRPHDCGKDCPVHDHPLPAKDAEAAK